ncbi:MAG: 50S ribosomal protein L32e [Nitrososphaerales archaeon]
MSEQGSKKSTRIAPSSRAEIAKLLEVRRRIKEKTPEFQRFESWRYVRIHEPWRKPKGIDNHMRLSVKGWPHLVKIGYRVPKGARHLHPSGYKDILVHNVSELEKLSPETDAARIAAGVGRKKKIEIAGRARELGIRVLNGKNLLINAKTEEAKAKEEKEKVSSKSRAKKRKEERKKKK